MLDKSPSFFPGNKFSTCTNINTRACALIKTKPRSNLITNSNLKYKFRLCFVFVSFISNFLFLTSISAATTDSIYIKLGEASTKKVDLTVSPPRQQSGKSDFEADGIVKNHFYLTLLNDFAVSSLFNIYKKMPKDQKTEFNLEIGYHVEGEKLLLEIKGFKNNELKPHYGESIRGPLHEARKMAHLLANNYLKNLTGKSGPFLSKVVVARDLSSGTTAKEVFILDWDGANPQQITHYKHLVRSPNWSWDGNKIAYTAFVKLGNTNFTNPALILYDLTTNRPQIISNRIGNNSGASFSTDNQAVFMTSSFEGNNDIYKVSTISGAIMGRLTKGPLAAMNIEPAVSPNGQKIAFASDRGGITALYLMNVDGTNVKLLTAFREFANSPSWSPDGSKIAFAAQDTGNFDIFVIDSDGGVVKRITQGIKTNKGKLAQNEYPTFSPDGRFVMYTSNRTGKNQIYISTLDGKNEYRITNDKYNYYSPKLSLVSH
jgi:TolB protein